MNSRYGLWMVCVCGIGLAGCANWQNRASNGPGGTAAIQNSLGGPPVVAPAPGVAPGTTFNEPPPPVPPSPSDPGAMLAPLGSASAPRLDLSEAGGAPMAPSAAPPAAELYNMGGGPAPKAASASVKSGATGSSTLSKLATKAGTASPAAPAAPKSSGLSTVKRLEKASSPDETENSALPVPKKAAEKEIVEPAPKATRKQEPDASIVDTALLAQPVRKGAADDDKKDSDNSKGPQSSIAPGKKPFEKNKALIYPVSNPAKDRPVDITQFS